MLMAGVVSGPWLIRFEQLRASVFIGIGPLFFGLLCSDDARDVIQGKSILVAERQVFNGFTVCVPLLDNLEAGAMWIAAVTW